MEQEIIEKFFEDCRNMDISKLPGIARKVDSHDEKVFIMRIYDYFLQKKQRECIENGKF